MRQRLTILAMTCLLGVPYVCAAQTSETAKSMFDPEQAKAVGADDYGMNGILVSLVKICTVCTERRGRPDSGRGASFTDGRSTQGVQIDRCDRPRK